MLRNRQAHARASGTDRDIHTGINSPTGRRFCTQMDTYTWTDTCDCPLWVLELPPACVHTHMHDSHSTHVSRACCATQIMHAGPLGTQEVSKHRVHLPWSRPAMKGGLRCGSGMVLA
jgi:hypothetical protein